MREIEFRGKRTDTGEWVYGNLWHNDAETMIIEQPSTNEYDVDENTVGQYTGLKDKNGKKIFEGDIIKVQYENREIVFNRIGWDSGFGLTGFASASLWEKENFNLQGFYDADRCIYDEELEVIGNRWDNPELLEEEE